MKHNDYEFLLNNIYYQGVLRKEGINADVYQKMQNEYHNLSIQAAQIKINGEHEFKKSFFIVRSYVQQAINDGMKSFRFKMQSADVTKLSYLVAMLNRNFFDKKGLDLIISNANSVFSQYNLKN